MLHPQKGAVLAQCFLLALAHIVAVHRRQVDLKALVRQSDEVAVKRWLRCVALKSVHEYLWPNLSRA